MIHMSEMRLACPDYAMFDNVGHVWKFFCSYSKQQKCPPYSNAHGLLKGLQDASDLIA